ncbi:MAG: LysR family transcriptional regulator, partial [Slackia sp.]|nr:LysR family transcriptional regulator [Slackia sp.]
MLDARVSTFLAVCRTLNYTHAARELSLTQSAVSQHMAYLERAYGTKLVAFEGKTMRLTDEGRLLQRAFLSFAHDEALLQRNIASVSSGEAVRLNVGTTLTAGEYIVGPALARYLGKNPHMRVTVASRSTDELLELMDKGSIDCAFVEGIFEKSAFAWDLLCEQELLCVCAPDHMRAGGACRMEDLFCETLIVRERESGSRAVLEHALRGQNLTLSSFSDIMEVSSIGIIKAFVAAGLGVSFVYEAGVARELACGSLRRIDVGGKPISHDISFVRPKNSVFEEDFSACVAGVRAECRRGS